MKAPEQAFASKPLMATAPKFVDKPEADSLQRAIQERIAQRAYQLYQQSGYEGGNDQKHWFQAEADVVQQTLTVRESGSWVAVNGHLPGLCAEDVQIYVDPRRVVVRAKKPNAQEAAASGEPETTDSYLVAGLGTDVEPATATAALKDGRLSLMVKKCSPSDLSPIHFA